MNNETRNMKTKVTVEMLAGKFSAILRSWLTPEQMAKVVADNKAETDSLVCHSHDYCDANQAMLDALEEFGLDASCDDSTPDWQHALVRSAWNLAKANGFAIAKPIITMAAFFALPEVKQQQEIQRRNPHGSSAHVAADKQLAAIAAAYGAQEFITHNDYNS